MEREPDTARALNRYAREAMKLRLLADIRADIAACELEGWSRTEYIQEIRKMLTEILGEFF